MICLMQLLHYEAQKNKKKKHILECEACPFKDTCVERKEKEHEQSNFGVTTVHCARMIRDVWRWEIL